MSKHNTKLIALIVAILVLMFAFVGCGKNVSLDGTATVVVVGTETKTYTVDLKKAEFTTQNSAYDVLRKLGDSKELKLSGTVSAFGIYLTELGELKPTGNQFIAFFSNKASDKDVSEFAEEIKYEGVTLYNSGLGVTNAKLVKGMIIYFKISTF